MRPSKQMYKRILLGEHFYRKSYLIFTVLPMIMILELLALAVILFMITLYSCNTIDSRQYTVGIITLLAVYFTCNMCEMYTRIRNGFYLDKTIMSRRDIVCICLGYRYPKILNFTSSMLKTWYVTNNKYTSVSESKHFDLHLEIVHFLKMLENYEWNEIIELSSTLCVPVKDLMVTLENRGEDVEYTLL